MNMATIKSYTDYPQSKVLSKILSDESADMHYPLDIDFMKHESVPTVTEEDDHFELFQSDIPCWSLSALLNILPKIEHLKPFIDLSPELDSDKVAIYYHSENSPYIVRDNLIDACYEMILKLHELKML
jgi:hypothetical protein